MRHSCCLSLMRFKNAGLVWVRWYWTDLPPLDVPTVYGSQFWISEGEHSEFDDGTVGEVFGSEIPYRKGEAPAGVTGTPQGSADAWIGQPEDGESLYSPCGTWPFDYNLDYNTDYDGQLSALGP